MWVSSQLVFSSYITTFVRLLHFYLFAIHYLSLDGYLRHHVLKHYLTSFLPVSFFLCIDLLLCVFTFLVQSSVNVEANVSLNKFEANCTTDIFGPCQRSTNIGLVFGPQLEERSLPTLGRQRFTFLIESWATISKKVDRIFRKVQYLLYL